MLQVRIVYIQNNNSGKWVFIFKEFLHKIADDNFGARILAL